MIILALAHDYHSAVEAFILLSITQKPAPLTLLMIDGCGSEHMSGFLLPTPLMPEQMTLNLVKGKIGNVASHYKVAHKV